MKRLTTPLALVFVISMSLAVRADSNPAIAGLVSGIELCPQSICGAAIFVGVFSGQVGANPRAIGTMAVAIKHEDLPELGHVADITGGVWRIRLLSGRTFVGSVTGGVLANPYGDNTYQVRVEMQVDGGGSGSFSFAGLLSHNDFPPTIVGALSQ